MCWHHSRLQVRDFLGYCAWFITILVRLPSPQPSPQSTWHHSKWFEYVGGLACHLDGTWYSTQVGHLSQYWIVVITILLNGWVIKILFSGSFIKILVSGCYHPQPVTAVLPQTTRPTPQAPGECSGSVVDSSCWWRLAETHRTVNSTCVDNRVVRDGSEQG